LYYCFGCKKGGNIFTFLKEVEGLDFPDAVSQLAREAGINIEKYYDDNDNGKPREKLDSLRKINELAATFYTRCLWKARDSEIARKYLQQRKIEEESWEKWRLGFAPDGWEHLLTLAERRGIDRNILEAAGLIIPRSDGNGHYDRFRMRLMFPVSDRNERIIGFGARTLGDDDAKYLNTPETDVFNKRNCFYGFYHAREDIRASKSVVIVEGYTDVIMAHQFGFTNVLAVLGTALTEYHARTLSNLCEDVILLFDGDEAGEKSTIRSIEVLLREDVEPRVARLEPGTDPCDFLLSHGAEGFEQILKNSENFLEFRLRQASGKYDLDSANGRAKAFEELAELALATQNMARRDLLIRQIADEVGMASPQSAFAYLEGKWDRHRFETRRLEDSGAETVFLSADANFASTLLGFLLHYPHFQIQARQDVNPDELPDSPETKALTKLLSGSSKEGGVSGGDFINQLDSEELTACVSVAYEQETKRKAIISTLSAKERYEKLIEYITERNIKRQKHTLLASIAGKDKCSAEEEDEKLREYIEMRRKEDEKASRINPRKVPDERKRK
jgi:DNA primase